MIFFKKPECEICKAPDAKDVLVIPKIVGRATRQKVCRMHFLDGFKKAVLAHPHKMIVTYPLLTIKHAVYGYYPVTEMEKYAYEKTDAEAIQKFLLAVPIDKVGFFDRTNAESAMENNIGQHSDLLKIENMKLISKEEAWSQIQSSFSLYTHDFDDGFTVPYGGEGVFLTSLLWDKQWKLTVQI